MIGMDKLKMLKRRAFERLERKSVIQKIMEIDVEVRDCLERIKNLNEKSYEYYDVDTWMYVLDGRFRYLDRIPYPWPVLRDRVRDANLCRKYGYEVEIDIDESVTVGKKIVEIVRDILSKKSRILLFGYHVDFSEPWNNDYEKAFVTYIFDENLERVVRFLYSEDCNCYEYGGMLYEVIVFEKGDVVYCLKFEEEYERNEYYNVYGDIGDIEYVLRELIGYEK